MKQYILAFSATVLLAFAAPLPSYAKDANTDTTTSAPKVKECKKGKLCGDTCIAKKAVCNAKSGDTAATAESKPEHNHI